MKKALFIMLEDMVDQVYDRETQVNIREHFEIIGKPLTRENCLDYPELLADVEIIFSGWGGPIFDEDFLKAAPNVEAIFYAAGSMKKLITDGVWRRGITVTTANSVNAIPVAEYTISQILFSLKNGWQITRRVRQEREFYFNNEEIPGAYKQTIGLISLSQVGRHTLELLKPYDLDVVIYDPYVTEQEVKELGVEMVSLKELFEVSDVVSLHSPLLSETRGMITGELLSTMKPGATFINTARGAIVEEEELIDVLKEREDLTAILDVTYPEPPTSDSALYEFDNIVVTPHIAGSAGNEVARMGAAMFEEAMHYLNNEPLKYQISEEQFRHMA